MKNSTNSSVAQQTLHTPAESGYIFSASSGAQKTATNSARPFSKSFTEKLTDKELYGKCKYYGEAARMLRQKFIGLLPEVNRRRLYEKKGFFSIFEFAAKLCGLSEEQVRLALNLERRFEDKPVLKKMLENGEISINKLERVAFIATNENEKELAEKVKTLPTSALNIFVKDLRHAEKAKTGDENQNGFNKPLFEDKFTYVRELEFEITDDVKQDLNELHAKRIDVNEFLREMIKKRQEKIAEKKAEISKTAQPTTSRYIPAETRKILKQEFGEKCSISTCQKSDEIIHHTQRFSLSQNHDPRFLAPLCREHHIIAHNIDYKYQKMTG